ncbi:MAG: 50S ribosomal protein L32e [Nanoarchaeota archaeon]
MDEIKKLLEARKIQKAKKPAFIRQDAHKKPKLKENWRRPKGSDSKMRLSKRGYSKTVKVGYRSPVLVRGLTREGLMPVRVFRKDDITSLDPKKECLILASGIGLKKKIEMLETALEKGFAVLNYKDLKQELDSLKEQVEKKKKEKQKAAEVKKEKEKQKEEESRKKEEEEKKEKESEEQASKESEDAPKEEKSLDEITDEEEKKKQEEKKEKDKVLTKKS